MKQIKFNVIFLLALMMLIGACTDEDRIRIPEFEDAVNMRIMPDPDFQTIDATDIPNAIARFQLFTENDNIQTVELYVEYYNLQSDSLYPRLLLRTIAGSEFNSNDGIIRNYDISLQEIANAYQFDLDLMRGGDRVDFYNVTTLTDGRVYPGTVDLGNGNMVSNVTPNVMNAAATTSFTSSITLYVACPIDPNFGTGNYTLEQVSGPADPFFGGATLWANPQVVNIAAVNPIQRQFAATYATLGGNFQFFLVCGQILVPKFGIGIGCGPGISYQQVGELTYVQDDDGVFTMTLLDNVDSDCGLAPTEVVLRLTKM